MKIFIKDVCPHVCTCVDDPQKPVYGKVPKSRIHMQVLDDDGKDARPDLVETDEDGFTIWTIGGPEEDHLTEAMKHLYKSGYWNLMTSVREVRDA